MKIKFGTSIIEVDSINVNFTTASRYMYFDSCINEMIDEIAEIIINKYKIKPLKETLSDQIMKSLIVVNPMVHTSEIHCWFNEKEMLNQVVDSVIKTNYLR